MATSALTALFACGQAPTGTQAVPQVAAQQAPARTVLDFGTISNGLNFNQVVKALPKRIAAADASRYLVHIDPGKVVASAPHFGVLDVSSHSHSTSVRTSGYSHGYDYGLSYPFNQIYASSYYYPYGNYYVPYYLNSGYYYPYNYYNMGLIPTALGVGSPYLDTYGFPYTAGAVPTVSAYSYNVPYTYPFLYSQGAALYPYTYTGFGTTTVQNYPALGAPMMQTVTITDGGYTPSTLSVPAGTSVTWRNAGTTTHTATSDVYSNGQWDSGPIPPGSSYSTRFTYPGIYHYHCSIHPTMQGTIVVQ